MDVRAFCTSTRVLIVAGKGGVGKTTVAATLARVASRAGLRCLIVEVERRSGLAEAFGCPDGLEYREAILSAADALAGTGEVRARTISPDAALIEYLDDHGMRRVSRQLARTGALDVVATAVPGLKDLLVLGKVKQLEQAAAAGQPGPAGEPPADLIIVDAPAAGHAVTFLQSASGLRDAVAVGPIRGQAQDVAALLADAGRCRVVLVTLPEETPVNECVETAYALEDRVGLKLGPVVVNSVFPDAPWLDRDPVAVATGAGVLLGQDEATPLRQAARLRQRRYRATAAQQARLAESLPLPQLSLPYLFAEQIGPSELDRLADAFAAEVERLDDPAPVA